MRNIIGNTSLKIGDFVRIFYGITTGHFIFGPNNQFYHAKADGSFGKRTKHETLNRRGFAPHLKIEFIRHLENITEESFK